MRARAFPVVVALGAAAVLAGRRVRGAELEGITLSDSVSVEGRSLVLNGIGVRRKVVLGLATRVYVAGLYLEHASADAAAVTSAREIKRFELVFLRDVARDAVARAISEGFERNAAADLASLRPRLDRLAALLPDVKEGDRVTLTCVPGEGTRAAVDEKDKGTIEGDDFARALVLVWLGASPVDEDLKRALLRGPHDASSAEPD